ncbi:MAG: MjaI family restriction endonuclease [Bacteroidetes bacterium]|nr:MjaI family restriction endonuclease [Bacteroidota bacterium]
MKNNRESVIILIKTATMDKEWIAGSEGENLKFKRETLLNYGMNRWGLNKAHSVGSTSELIRTCAPTKYEEWEEFYFTKATQKSSISLRRHKRKKMD